MVFQDFFPEIYAVSVVIIVTDAWSKVNLLIYQAFV